MTGVRTLHPDYADNAATWKRCRDAAAGERAVHVATTEYLPKLAEESSDAYTARLRRTPFFNATWRTIVGMLGMLFREPPKIENVPFSDNVDAAGTTAASFAQRVALELLTVGRIGVLTDHPVGLADGATVAEVEAAGIRPVLKIYPAESIINWKTKTINNAVVLSLVVLAESEPAAEDEFGHETEARWRVLDLDPTTGAYRQRVFAVNDRGEDVQIGDDVFPKMNGAPMREMPFVFINADGIGSGVELPPLVDLVDLNLHHYAVSADYEHGCHFSGLPTLFISGHSPQTAEPGQPSATIYIGGPAANCLPNPAARAEYVQPSGNFEALRQNLEDKKAMMAVLGARMLEAQKAAAETAETVGQNRKGEESVLATIGGMVSAGLTRSFELMAAWARGAVGDVVFRLTDDFSPVGMGAQELTAMVSAWQAGMPGFSDQNVFDQLQNRGVIEEGVTFEEEQARIADVGPRIVAPVPTV